MIKFNKNIIIAGIVLACTAAGFLALFTNVRPKLAEYRNSTLDAECYGNIVEVYYALEDAAVGAAEDMTVDELVSAARTANRNIGFICPLCQLPYTPCHDMDKWKHPDQNQAAIALSCPCKHETSRMKNVRRIIYFGASVSTIPLKQDE